jgi:branched-chain amino acid transport system substrate-binding protein
LYLPRLLLLVALGTLTLSMTGIPQMVRAADPFELNVILPMTGGAAFLGQSEATTFKVVESIVNNSGGIKGRPLKFTILDDQTSPQVAVQLANQLIAKKVAVFLGPGVSAMCGAVAGVLAKTTVDYCLSPAIHPPAGSYQFSASISTGDLAVMSVRYFRLKGWTNMALLSTTDATGQDIDRQVAAALALPENRIVKLVAHEHFAGSDVTVAAQIARIKSSNPQALIVWATGTPFPNALHGVRDGGLEVPVLTGSGNMSIQQLESMASFLPSTLLFAGNRSMAPEGTLPGPVKDAQIKYFDAFKAVGMKPDFGNSINWDATMIVVDALRKYGPDATAEQIHDFIENLHSWPGTNGIYDFRDGSQRGIGSLGGLVLRWDPVKKDYTVMSRAGGYLK